MTGFRFPKDEAEGQVWSCDLRRSCQSVDRIKLSQHKCRDRHMLLRNKHTIDQTKGQSELRIIQGGKFSERTDPLLCIISDITIVWGLR